MPASPASAAARSTTADASSTAPAPKPGDTVADASCDACGGPLVYIRAGPHRPLRPHCNPCHAAYLRRWRESRRDSRLLPAPLRTRTPVGFYRALHRLVASCGGFEALEQHLAPEDRARLAAHALGVVAQAEQREQEHLARQQEATVRLESDPQLQADLLRMAIEHLSTPGPGKATALGGVIRRRIADLRRLGWTIEPPPAEDEHQEQQD